MAIDDPVGILIRQTREESEAESYLPNQFVRLIASATAAAALVQYPFASQIVTALLSVGPARFEKRLFRVLKEMDAQQKRIEDRIPDKSYYESEEFQTLLVLILERLNTTHDQQKLKAFGDALANSGSPEFQHEDGEGLIRVLRDLSRTELETLNDDRLKQSASPSNPIQYGASELTCLSRVAGLGLEHEQRISGWGGVGPPIGDDRIYVLSDFGVTFLKFIADETETTRARS